MNCTLDDSRLVSYIHYTFDQLIHAASLIFDQTFSVIRIVVHACICERFLAIQGTYMYVCLHIYINILIRILKVLFSLLSPGQAINEIREYIEYIQYEINISITLLSG